MLFGDIIEGISCKGTSRGNPLNWVYPRLKIMEFKVVIE